MVLRKYGWIRHYLKCAAKGFIHAGDAHADNLLFVVVDTSKGWILDAICRELAQNYPGNASVYYHDGVSSLPDAQAYFFSHYSQLAGALTRQPIIWRRKCFVWYTHNSDESCGAKPAEIIFALNRMDKIFTTNSRLNHDLANAGVKSDKLKTLLGAADPLLFTPTERKSRVVGLSMAYYERKNPELVAELVATMPDISFVLVGRNWEHWAGFEKLKAQTNFQYIVAPYEQYPGIYKGFDVFLSPSKLEGGPIPLVETMMCNVVPVVSDTGFARDIIQPGKNGFIFDIDARADTVANTIRQALKVDWDIASSVSHLSWLQMSKELFLEVSEAIG